ncbi:hypothetical protein Misp04_34520 [Micromonospora sp. NBRC 101691]|nr:hypothetical protein Misp04_34520 [Micromonospora sp. NBRC 101691]
MRQAAMVVMVVVVKARRASMPRLTVRRRAVNALTARVRSPLICSRATVRTRRAVRAPVARGQRSSLMFRPRVAWAIAMASRASLLPWRRLLMAGTSGASATVKPAAVSCSVKVAP